MNLSELPQFTVDEIRAVTGDPEVTLVGRLSHLRGVNNEGACLYRSATASMHGVAASLPVVAGDPVEFRTSDIALAPELRAGSVYPWIDCHWQAYHIAMILAGQWEPRRFQSTPARYFRLAGVTGWQPIDAPLMEDAEDLGVRDGGWDHEHCELCMRSISAAGGPEAFVDPAEHWLCAECCERYALTRDVSFAVEV